jgi:4-amino-4-deoxy-L-arabinose transferase-like glycosyltransferase
MFVVSAVLLHQRTADFWGEDVFYADAARSLLHDGFYGVNGNPETTQPPGLALILAPLFFMFGNSYGVCVGAMAVFEIFGFLVVYEILRRRVPKLIAGSICIVLLSSPLYFAWATRMVYPCFPYFFTTMVALLSGEEYDNATTAPSRIIWGTVMATAVAASLLIATGTIALLARSYCCSCRANGITGSKPRSNATAKVLAHLLAGNLR